MGKKLLAGSLLLVIGISCFIYFSANHKPLNNSKLRKTSQKFDKIIKTDRSKRMQGLIGFDEPREFVKLHRTIRTRDDKSSPDYPPNYRIKELLKARQVTSTKALSKLAVAQPLPWTERGPANVSGRTRGLIVDPDDATKNTWFAGSVGGGIWKTTDAGQTWVNKTPNLSNLATTTLAMAESNHDVMYAGTGEGFPNLDGINGDGIWKSIDRGETWQQLASTASNGDFQNVNRIVVDPADEDILLTATNTGIFRSIDGGATWNEVFRDANGSPVQHLIANPLNFNTLFASVNSMGVLKSSDAGLTWGFSLENLGPFSFPSGRLELAIAPSDTSRIYAALDVDSNTTSQLYMSRDAGATWSRVDDIGNDPNWLGGQGWYDNTIAVHPFNPDTVFVGGINIWKIALETGEDTEVQIAGVDTMGTSPFLAFINWGGPAAGGGIGTGDNFHGLASSAGNTGTDDFVDIEIRFGPGRSQKAHRFLFGANFLYPFQDYVDVPFEVWDITNNQQLMVSFRDWQNDMTFDLIEADFSNNFQNLQREYLFVNAVPYDPNNPDPNIAQTGGEVYKNIYAMWPILATGGTWDPNNLPESNLTINKKEVDIRFRSTEQITAYTFPQQAPFNVHVDHHNLVMIPVNEATNSFRILNGNDGGVYYSNDGGATWINTLNGYNTTQFYGADKKPGANEYVGGMQDNGTWQSPFGQDADAMSQYLFKLGGDGFNVSWNFGDANKIIGGSQFNFIGRTLDGGQTWFRDFEAVETGSGNAPFVTNIAASKSDPDLIFLVGASGVWRSDTFGDSWTLIPIAEPTWSFSGRLTQVEISIANPQIVWAGARMNSSTSPDDRIHASVDGGVTFEPVNLYDEDVTLGVITGFATHPTEDSTAYAIFSIAEAPKILRTTDLGQTWEDISGFGANSTSNNGFPDVAVYSLLVMPFDTDIIWAGTEIGIFESVDGGQTWAYADNGLPAVAVWELKIVDDQVVAATHGRGIWSVTLPDLAGHTPPVATLSPRFNEIGGGAGGVISIDIGLRSAYDSSFVLVDGEKFLALSANTAAKDTTVSIIVAVAEVDTVAVSISAYENGAVFKNVPTDIVVFPLLEALITYENDFNLSSDDFVFNGFEITLVSGFQNGAIHSQHPYPEATDLTAILKAPIIVAEENSILRYDDIAIIEPGAGSGIFGDPDFFDFVIVEGSNDNGATWLPLAPGYDARFDSTVWLATYDAEGAGDASMYRSHELNLQDTFEAGETILVRFRLFSDPFTVGWGWALDNLSIQGGPVSVAADDALPEVFSLSKNYPNPFNPSTKFNYALPEAAEVTLEIYNVLGQKVRELIQNKPHQAGSYTAQWDGKNDWGTPVSSGVYVYRIKAGDFVKSYKMMLLK